METKAAFTKGHARRHSDVEFHELTRRDAQSAMNKELMKLISTAQPGQQDEIRTQFDCFEEIFGRYLRESGPSVQWDKIKLIPDEALKSYSDLPPTSLADIKDVLDKLVVIKLNGGLGTGMGCTGPKSAICVRNDRTFLDLNVQQLEHLNKTYHANVPLILMNSFNTDEDTQKLLRKYKQVQVDIVTFNQSRYPRINRESMLPIPRSFGADSSEGDLTVNGLTRP